MKFKLEICVDNVESAITAQNAGTDRIELCDNLLEGGTTPGYGSIISARDNLSIDLNVIIRPRGGDFLYSDLEYDVMRRDIDVCGENGINGIVIGILNADGSVDVERTARLIEYASPMTVTFHRAFDLCADPIKGLEEIISTGATRLLTSGHKNSVIEGSELIANLVKQAGKRIIILPGSGINEANIARLARDTGAVEFHLSGRKIIESEMVFRRENIAMGGIKDNSEYYRKIADFDSIKRINKILSAI